MGNSLVDSASFKEDVDEYMKRRRSMSETSGRKDTGESVPNITEIRGFVIWIFTIVSYFVFILWTLLPRDSLIYMGVSYYPSKYVFFFFLFFYFGVRCDAIDTFPLYRYWALALPSYIIITGILVIIAYAGANLSITPSLDSMSTFTDEYARKPRDRSQRTNLEMQGQVPEVSDLPLRVVNRLFLSKLILLPSSSSSSKKKKKKKKRSGISSAKHENYN